MGGALRRPRPRQFSAARRRSASRHEVIADVKSILRALWAGWKRFGFLLGTINRYVLLTVFYWVIVNVTNVIVRVLRIDLLDRRMRPKPSYWTTRSPAPSTYRNQF
jgi:hypothetical protein